MNNDNQTWYDAVDTRPELVCLVETTDGNILEAVNRIGTWETLDGQRLFITRYTPARFQVIVPTYKYKE